jgi:hypothetical protein
LITDAVGIVVLSVDVSRVESLTHSITTAQLNMLELSINQVDLTRGNKSKCAKYNIVFQHDPKLAFYFWLREPILSFPLVQFQKVLKLTLQQLNTVIVT